MSSANIILETTPACPAPLRDEEQWPALDVLEGAPQRWAGVDSWVPDARRGGQRKGGGAAQIARRGGGGVAQIAQKGVGHGVADANDGKGNLILQNLQILQWVIDILELGGATSQRRKRASVQRRDARPEGGGLSALQREPSSTPARDIDVLSLI